MRISSSTTYMKTQFATNNTQHFFWNGAGVDIPVKIYFENTDLITSYYFGVQVYYNNYSVVDCIGPYLVTAGNGQQITYSIQGIRTDVSNIDVLYTTSNSVDGDNCLDTSVEYINILTNDSTTDAASISGGASTIQIVPSTTSLTQIANNPSLDWFLGFLIFFICMTFPIWLFRRK